MHTQRLLCHAAIALLLLPGCGDDGASLDAAVSTDAPMTAGPFGDITMGKIAQYHDQDGPRQDLSGAAMGERIIFVDDGGSPSDLSGVLVGTISEDPPFVHEFAEIHRDLEGATFGNEYYVVTTSLSDAADAAYRQLTRFRFDDSDVLVDVDSVDMRDDLMEALRVEFGDDWYDRIKDEPGNAGGLNIEGITRSEHDGPALVWGLRSPLFGDDFGNPASDPDNSLDSGVAIVAIVDDAFAPAPAFSFDTLDLDGHGIRGIEWIPAMQTYVVIGGSVPKADGYTLWTWSGPDRGTAPEPLPLSGFSSLCRPESVIQETRNELDYLVVLSEESGGACDDAVFTFIRARIL